MNEGHLDDSKLGSISRRVGLDAELIVAGSSKPIVSLDPEDLSRELYVVEAEDCQFNSSRVVEVVGSSSSSRVVAASGMYRSRRPRGGGGGQRTILGFFQPGQAQTTVYPAAMTFDLENRRPLMLFSASGTARRYYHPSRCVASFCSTSEGSLSDIPLILVGTNDDTTRESLLVYNSATGYEAGVISGLPTLNRLIVVPAWSNSVFGSSNRVECPHIFEFDIETQTRVGQFEGHRDAIGDVAVDPARGLIFSVGWDGVINFWSRDTRRPERVHSLRGAGCSIHYCELRSRLFAGTASGNLEIWDCRMTRKRLRVVSRFAREEICEIQRLSDDHFVALAKNGTIKTFDEEGKVGQTSQLGGMYHGGPVGVVSFSKKVFDPHFVYADEGVRREYAFSQELAQAGWEAGTMKIVSSITLVDFVTTMPRWTCV